MHAKPWTFFVLVFVLSVPFVLVGELTGARLPANLPVSALQFVLPVVVAVFLVYRSERGPGVRRLLRRTIDLSRVRQPIWFLPVLLLMPTVTVLAYFFMLLAGESVPEPRISILSLLVYAAVFVLAGAFEEVGWTGYATDELQKRWGALSTGLIVGAVWAAWHAVPYLQLHDPAWAFWNCVSTVAARVIIVWLYDNTGRSVSVAILFHASINVCYSLFPVDGSHYDPVYVAPLTILVAVLVSWLWGPKTLARYRYSAESARGGRR